MSTMATNFRMRTWLAAVLWTCLLAGAVVGADFGAEGPPPPTPQVFVSADSVPSGGTFEVIADFDLADKVKLYRDQLRFVWLRVKGAELVEEVFPEPKEVADPLAEEPGPTMQVYQGQVRLVTRWRATAGAGSRITLKGRLHHQSCTDVLCFPPMSRNFAFELAVTEPADGSPAIAAPGRPTEAGKPEAAPRKEVNFPLELILAFVWGIGIGFSPCVYPMIPITAAIIGAKRDRGLLPALGSSLVYVLGLAIVYAVLGLLASTFGAGVQAIIHAWYVVVPIAAIFVALAAVLLAGWNLAAPTGFASRLQGMLAGRKGVVATFALGAVGGVIVGPCVLAPLLALLSRVFAAGSKLLGFWALFAAAWGMGVPLIILGTATGILPKAGEWMNWVKKLMAFVLLWAALYFLLPLIGDTAYNLAFAVLLVVAAVFLGGFDRLTKESTFGDRAKKVLGVLAVAYALVLFLSVLGGQPGAPPSTRTRTEDLFRDASAEDAERALAAGRPVLLDFYADWCVICKALDKKVFTRPEAVRAASGLDAFKIDTDEHPELAKRFNVKGPPTVLFVGPDGQVRKDLSFVGEKTLDEFLERLERFKSETSGARTPPLEGQSP